jgi:hypothetical protein
MRVWTINNEFELIRKEAAVRHSEILSRQLPEKPRIDWIKQYYFWYKFEMSTVRVKKISSTAGWKNLQIYAELQGVYCLLGVLKCWTSGVHLPQIKHIQHIFI